MTANLIQQVSFASMFFLLIACGAKKSPAGNQDPAVKDTLVFTGCQEKIDVKAGSVIELRLEATEGTGYQWLLKKPAPLIEQIDSDVLRYLSHEDKEPVAGQASLQVLKFKVIQKGEAEIQLDYRRTFEEGIEKSCIIKIISN